MYKNVEERTYKYVVIYASVVRCQARLLESVDIKSLFSIMVAGDGS